MNITIDTNFETVNDKVRALQATNLIANTLPGNTLTKEASALNARLGQKTESGRTKRVFTTKKFAEAVKDRMVKGESFRIAYKAVAQVEFKTAEEKAETETGTPIENDETITTPDFAN